MIVIEAANVEWLDVLPNTPKRVLKELVAAGSSPEEALELWLGGAHQGNVAPMGGGGAKKSEYSALLYRELRLLICTDDPKYKTVRDQIPKINKGSLVGVTATLSSCLAPQLGMASALVAPAVVLALLSIAKISVEAWCAQSVSAQN